MDNKQSSSSPFILSQQIVPLAIQEQHLVSPPLAKGDMIYSHDGVRFAALPIGSSTQIMGIKSGLPSWIASGGTNGQVLTITGGIPLWSTPASIPVTGFATSGPQADANTTSSTFVDITGATLTINPSTTVTVQAWITGDFYDVTGTSHDCTFQLVIDGVSIQSLAFRPSAMNFRAAFSLSGQASVASGARIIKAQYNVAGGDTLHADQTNVSVIFA